MSINGITEETHYSNIPLTTTIAKVTTKITWTIYNMQGYSEAKRV